MKKQFLYPAAACIVFALCLLLFSSQTGKAQGQNQEARAEALEKSLYRAALTCYACEGAYPDRLSYLCDNYGISVDEGLYAVYYDIFASNIMPEITVVTLSEK